MKESNKTYDSLHTDYKAEDYAFTILANTFKTRTKQEWNKKYLLSFGLVRSSGNLTNAGALFADDCPLWQSRLYCTLWDGKAKGDAINDAEFTGNVLMLLREAMNFVKSSTKKGWEKLPNGRKNKPEYTECIKHNHLSFRLLQKTIPQKRGIAFQYIIGNQIIKPHSKNVWRHKEGSRQSKTKDKTSLMGTDGEDIAAPHCLSPLRFVRGLRMSSDMQGHGYCCSRSDGIGKYYAETDARNA